MLVVLQAGGVDQSRRIPLVQNVVAPEEAREAVTPEEVQEAEAAGTSKPGEEVDLVEDRFGCDNNLLSECLDRAEAQQPSEDEVFQNIPPFVTMEGLPDQEKITYLPVP